MEHGFAVDHHMTTSAATHRMRWRSNHAWILLVIALTIVGSDETSMHPLWWTTQRHRLCCLAISVSKNTALNARSRWSKSTAHRWRPLSSLNVALYNEADDNLPFVVKVYGNASAFLKRRASH
jgi:hypothetical protein